MEQYLVKVITYIGFVAKDTSNCHYADTIRIVITSTTNLWSLNIQNLEVYPLPAKKVLNIILPLETKEGNIILYNTEGKVMFERKILAKSNKLIQLDIASLPNDVYFIDFHTKNSKYRAKLVKSE